MPPSSSRGAFPARLLHQRARRSARLPRDNRPGGWPTRPRADTGHPGCRAAGRSGGTGVPGFARRPAPGRRRSAPGPRRCRAVERRRASSVERRCSRSLATVSGLDRRDSSPVISRARPERSRSIEPANRWPNPWYRGSGQSSSAWTWGAALSNRPGRRRATGPSRRPRCAGSSRLHRGPPRRLGRLQRPFDHFQAAVALAAEPQVVGIGQDTSAGRVHGHRQGQA